MEVFAALEPDQVKTGAVVALAVLVVVAFLVMRFIQKLIFKAILVIVLVVAGIGVYTQRDSLDDCQKRVRSGEIATGEKPCTCGFAGFDITIPQCAPPPASARS